MQEQGRVRIRYIKGEQATTFSGSLIGIAHRTERKYYSLQLDNGKRIYLRDDRVVALTPE